MATTVEIHFEGVMLFVIYRDRVEVLIPDTKSGLFADGRSGAVRHYPWLTSPRPGLPPARYGIRRALDRATINVGTTGQPANLAFLNAGVIPIDQTLAPGWTLNSQGIAATIVLKGGRFREGLHPDPWRHRLSGPGGSQVTTSSTVRTVVWAFDVDVPATDLPIGWTGQVGLKALSELDSPLYVSNLDVATPEEWQADPAQYSVGTPDTDFQLVYNAITPLNGNWSQVLVNNALPHPQLDRRPGPASTFFTPSGAKCKGARINA